MKPNKKILLIIGNGPSLKGVDLTSLSKHHSLGMNAAYRYWREIDWRPTYYACLDEVVGLSHRDEITKLIKEHRIEKFVLRSNLIQALGEVALDRRIINFDALHFSKLGFNTAPTITTGSHATLWGALLGYKQIVLLGIDGLYKELVDGAERREGITLEVTHKSNNPNYFFDEYQIPGDRYCIPNPRPGLHLEAWHDAAQTLKQFECTVYNTNPNSEVQFFPFIKLQSLLSKEEIVLRHEATIKVVDSPNITDTQHPLSRCSRMNHFLKSQWRWCVIPMVFFIATETIAILTTKMEILDAVMWAILAFVLYGMILFQLFQRFTLAQFAISTTTRISALETHELEHQRQKIIMGREEVNNTRS